MIIKHAEDYSTTSLTLTINELQLLIYMVDLAYDKFEAGGDEGYTLLTSLMKTRLSE